MRQSDNCPVMYQHLMATIYDGTVSGGAFVLLVIVGLSCLFFTGYGIYWVVMKLRGKEPRPL